MARATRALPGRAVNQGSMTHSRDHTLVLPSLLRFGRILNVFPLSFMCNLVRKQKIPWKMQVVIWFAGKVSSSHYQHARPAHMYETTTLA